MPRRTSPIEFQSWQSASELTAGVVDKRNHKRADAKRNRRNRHYVKLVIRERLDNLDAEDTD
ncbi:MAG: hypothetical protein H7Z72_18410 [Bacteroidetes bacterium]|nr:hypothetical protein [Fibrella sp.]